MADVDVLVVGSGAAGLSAALEAAGAGATVLVAEATEEVGGSSRLSTAMIMGAGTRFQAAAGVEDSPDQLYAEYLHVNQWRVDPGLVRRLADECGPAVEWLADLGVVFHETLSTAGDEGRPRVHCPVDLGAGVIDVLRRHVVQAGVDIALSRRVDRLLVEDDRVVGAAVDSDEVHAHAVVLATGGFGADPDKLDHWYPQTRRRPDWYWFMGAAGARGDALELADQVGAQVTGAGRGCSFLTPNFGQGYESYLPGWLVLVNEQGLRFCDETASYGVLESLVNHQGGVAWVIFDEASRRASPADRPALYKQQNPLMPGRRSPNWNDEVIAQMAREGRLVSAPTLEELADRLGLAAAALCGQIARYNEHVEAGADTDFRKEARFLRPVAEPPFYGAEVRPAVVALTSTGLRIDLDGHVLGTSGQAIAGLYAAGECTGGVLGDIYIGTGNSWANCLVFGRAAGRAAAHERHALGIASG